MKRISNNFTQGFTLIELLIVIMIIGILAGILLSVLNPAQQRTRAMEATMRANVAKLCLAWAACMSSSPSGSASDCDGNPISEIGADWPTTPNGASYSYTSGRFQGVLGGCTIYCGTNNVPVLSGCSIAS